jgi:hypothetical protein
MKNLLKVFVITPVVITMVGCAEMPGSREQQGAVIGGAAGAAAGAAIAKDNRLLGALIGGALGAGGGYVIAAQTDKVENNDREGAQQATRKAQENPATPEDARKAMTADLNMDGFVTLDEVVAMKQAGFDDKKIMERLNATDQVFELNAEQEKYLTDRGFSRQLVTQIEQVNRAKAEELMSRGDVINEPVNQPAP